MNPDLPPNAFAKYNLPSRVEKRRDRNAKQEANWRAVCQQVDRRDHDKCRACGSRCDPDALDLLAKGHRHHLEYRSKGGQDVASNLLTLCARCHDAEHRHTLRIEAETPYGADGPLNIWRKTASDQDWWLSRRETAVHRIERD